MTESRSSLSTSIFLPGERAASVSSNATLVRPLALSTKTTRSLRALAAAAATNLQSVLFASLVSLLSRYAGGREDVTVVTKVASEPGARLTHVVLARDLDARGLVRVAATALDDSRAGDPARASELPRRVRFVTDATIEVSEPAAWADLELVVERGSAVAGAPIEATLLLRASHFDDLAADRIANHLVLLLEGLASSSGPVATMRIVGVAERAELLARSGVDDVRLDEPHDTIVEAFERHVAARPEAVAVVDGACTLTYGQLDAAAEILADRLRALDLGKSPTVASYLERGASAIVSFVGILKAGGIYVPVDTSYPEGRVAAILEGAAPAVVITRLGLVPPSTGATLLHLDDGAAAPQGEQRARVAPQLEDVAYTIFTSGSTGRPKGVVVTHRTLANYVVAASEAYGVGPEDRVLQAASLGFDLSLEEIVVTLTAGAALVVRSAQPIASIQGFLEECVAGDVSILSTTSALWHELTMRLEDGSVSLPPRFRLVILGADAARPDVLNVWQRVTGGRVRLVNSYGLTETTIVATIWEDAGAPLDDSWRAVPIGRPLRNVSVYVLDDSDALVPFTVAGEICIGGLAVAAEYLGDEALTRARFVPDPFLPGQKMYRTGDRGVMRVNGELEFLGRSDYQLKVSGVRIELGEIESQLRGVTGVVEAVVIAAKGLTGEVELEAHVMIGAPEVTAEVLREHLGRVLPIATVPARISVVDRFPLTPAGKIDRRALASAERAHVPVRMVAPETPLEEVMAATVAEVLRIPAASMLASFASLGGTSLTAVRAASVLSHRLGQRLRAQLFFEASTLRQACLQLTQPASEETALERDARLDPQIVPQDAPGMPAPLATVLLTGGTGFYGTFVLADLLRDTKAHVICLVRASSPEIGFERISSGLRRRQCQIDARVLTERVSVVVGDIGLPRLGLDGPTFEALGERVDAIFHVGALVNMVLPYESLRAMNVLAVSTILELATTGRPKTVHHVSTVEVLSDMDPHEPRALQERPTGGSPGRLQEGYGQSKWVAEKLVEEARARGVRAFIHRPGRLMGHSQTGVFNADDFLVRMLDACGQVGAAPDLDVDVDITPTDYASRALVRLAQLEPMDVAVFHLVNPVAITWAALVAQIVGLGYPLRAVPFDQWCRLLEQHAPTSDRAEFLLYLAGMTRSEAETSIHGGHASNCTRAVLGDDLVCPLVDERLLAIYLGRLVNEGRFPGAVTRARSQLPPRLSRRPSLGAGPLPSVRP